MLIDCCCAFPKWHMCKEYSTNCKFQHNSFPHDQYLDLGHDPIYCTHLPLLCRHGYDLLRHADFSFTAYSLEPVLACTWIEACSSCCFPAHHYVWDSVVMKWGNIIHADCLKPPLCGTPSSVQLLWSVFAFCTSQTVILWTHFPNACIYFWGTTL